MQGKDEFSLREEIRESRRAFFRALRYEQSRGAKQPIRPRLAIDSIDNLMDENILKLVEGMDNADNCVTYQFLESRQREIGVKYLWKEYAKVLEKVKVLDDISQKQLSIKLGLEHQSRKRKLDELDPHAAAVKTRLIELKQRAARIKEFEKNLQAKRLATLKTLRKIRDDITVDIESRIEQERDALNRLRISSLIGEFSDLDSLRPKPVITKLHLDGECLSRIFEIREFLKVLANTKLISSAVYIPTIEEFIVWYKSFHHKTEMIVEEICRANQSFRLSNQLIKTPLAKQTDTVISQILCELASVVHHEIEKVLGLDMAVSQLGGLKLPINNLTWKEVFKILLTFRLCREVGMTEIDIQGFIKGRGYFTTPESADRKALKLAKKRLIFNHSIRSEIQETVTGFKLGICVSLPSPAENGVNAITWQEIVRYIVDESDREIWLALDLLRIAIELSDDSEVSHHLLKILEELQVTDSIPAAYKQLNDLIGHDIRCITSDIDRSYDRFVPHSSCRHVTLTPASIEEDKLLDDLSLPMKHCFNVLTALFTYEQAEPFIEPIDAASLPDYTHFIAKPISLSEIRSKLLMGTYADCISSFYKDVTLLFENSFAYNPESSNIRAYAIKLQIVFERLFYEMVLSCESPLISNDSCHLCRLSDPESVNLLTKCERCDGSYHITCFDPPLPCVPRSEWFCPACIEQKGIASVHPYRMSRVKYPESLNDFGDVVAIDQEDGDLIFTIDFGRSRECWKSPKVRECSVEDCFEALQCDETTLSELKSINYTDYDEACAISKGYSGWCPSNFPLPGLLMNQISSIARSTTDDSFQEMREILLLLTNDEYSSEEKVKLLKFFINFVMQSPSTVDLLPNQDSQDKVVTKICKLIIEDNSKRSPIAEKEANKMETEIDKIEVDLPAEREHLEGIQSADLDNLSTSFKRGQEDALTSTALMLEVLRDVDGGELTDYKDLLEPIHLESTEAIDSGATSIAKVCAGRIPDDVIQNDWSDGWDEQMKTINSADFQTVRCVFCQKDEFQLCSPLVRSYSLEEWISNIGMRLDETSRVLDDKLISSGTLSMDACRWKFPFHRRSSQPQVEAGSLIVHDYCADLIQKRRITLWSHLLLNDDKKVAEKVCRIGWPLTAPLGVDRNGSLYYMFEKPFHVYVGRPKCSSPLTEICNEYYDWEIYRDDDIRQLYNWLDGRLEGERLLKRIIKLVHARLFGSVIDFSLDIEEQPTSSAEQFNFPSSDGGSGNILIRHDYKVGDLVHYRSKHSNIHWPARIAQVVSGPKSKSGRAQDDSRYPVIFEDNGSRICRAEDLVLPSSQSTQFGLEEYCSRHVYHPPDVLRSLRAWEALGYPNRAREQRPPFTFSHAKNSLQLLKYAMLIVEASLPIGAVDTSEDRWSDNFAESWREGVSVAENPVSLMQCQIMLEYGIRTAWLKPAGLKLFSFLPSRIHALKSASFASLAVRLWTLDVTIRYDKLEDKKEVGKPTKKK